jgi:hypothetical protein
MRIVKRRQDSRSGGIDDFGVRTGNLPGSNLLEAVTRNEDVRPVAVQHRVFQKDFTHIVLS